jgi:hypothetical protein
VYLLLTLVYFRIKMAIEYLFVNLLPEFLILVCVQTLEWFSEVKLMTNVWTADNVQAS